MEKFGFWFGGDWFDSDLKRKLYNVAANSKNLQLFDKEGKERIDEDDSVLVSTLADEDSDRVEVVGKWVWI